jgi:hypothetical protein
VVVAETMDLEHLDLSQTNEQNPEDPVVAVVVLQEERHQTEMVHLELPTKDMMVVMVLLDHHQPLMPVVVEAALVLLDKIQITQVHPRMVVLVVLD